MHNRKLIVFFMLIFFTCFSVFGQDVTAVKEFERARRTIPISISLNIFGFGIGSFIQGDTIAGVLQIGLSTIGYALLLPGIFYPKSSLIGFGSALIAGNAIFGTIKPVMYQFDKKFDTFYDINNDAKWPGGF